MVGREGYGLLAIWLIIPSLLTFEVKNGDDNKTEVDTENRGWHGEQRMMRRTEDDTENRG
jgi:hypothetical protein